MHTCPGGGSARPAARPSGDSWAGAWGGAQRRAPVSPPHQVDAPQADVQRGEGGGVRLAEELRPRPFEGDGEAGVGGAAEGARDD